MQRFVCSKQLFAGAKFSRVISTVIAFFTLSAAIFAQVGATSQISGIVKDASGAAVPGAQVKATQTDTGLERTALTGQDGGYVLANLPVGPYRLEVSKTGFSTTAQTL